ncbi:MAG: hypothetical protein M9925_05225 [Chloroflexi bacterium]|nr:hypothetical protein [Chloroflexota bacterium]
MIGHAGAGAAEALRTVVEPLTGAATAYDALFDRIGDARFVLIGQSHCFKVDLARQFDDVIRIDVTTALQPLERNPLWDTGEPPETYLFGE